MRTADSQSDWWRIPLAAWADPAFLHLRLANLLLNAAVALFRLRLLPRAALRHVLVVTEALARRSAAHRERARRPWG